MSPDLPTLERLTADLSAAMHVAERASSARDHARRWRRPWPLAVAVFALAVPSAVALRAATHDRRVDVPVMKEALGPRHGTSPSGRRVTGVGQPVAIAEGTIAGHGYTFVAQRCANGDVVSLGTGFIYGRNGTRGGGGFSPCHPRNRRQPILQTYAGWTAGQSWINGITRDRVASVDLFLVRRARRPNGTQRSFAPSRTRVATRPLDPDAVRQGHLPRGYRQFVVFRPRRTDFTRLIARDARGRVLVDCRRRACDHIAFGGP